MVRVSRCTLEGLRVDWGPQSGDGDLWKMQTVEKGNQSVASEIATLDLEGLCSNFNCIYLPDVLTVEGWFHGTCSGSDGHVYSLASL